MDDIDISTSDNSTALSPAVGADIAAPTLGSDQGVGSVAQAAFDQATTGTTPDPIETALTAIPDSDDDLQAETDQTRRDAVIQQRTQLRVLKTAIRDLQPLQVFKEFGSPAAVKPRLELAKLLYSPLLGKNGQPVRDPGTQTTYVTTKPFIAYLDKVSPGMPEQLYVDLNYYRPLGEDGRTQQEELWKQHFRYLKLNPDRLQEYQNIDTLIARTSDAITLEELAEIPADRHAAYQVIPADVRAAWASFDKSTQTRLLQDYQDKLDTAAATATNKETAARAKAEADQRYAADVFRGQQQYFSKVRQERFAELYTDLAAQVTFSTDAAVNGVEIGSLCTVLANLVDPDWRFITVEKILTPLGLKLPAGFDEVLNKFNTAASDKVALEMAGDLGRSGNAEIEALNAVEQLMAKVAPIALKIAKARGAKVEEKAKVQASAVAAATAGRAAVTGTTPATTTGILPPGVRPGSPEAVRYIGEQSGMLQPRSA